VSEPVHPQTDAPIEREADSDIVLGLAPPDVYDPVIEAYKKDVDRTLIRENLKLTHEQRLQKLQDFTSFLAQLRNENASKPSAQ
jgi:hypothetical protein